MAGPGYNRTRLPALIANGGNKGRRSRNETADETNWFDVKFK